MKNYKATRATMMQWGKKNVVVQEGEAGEKGKKTDFFMFCASWDDVGKVCTRRQFFFIGVYLTGDGVMLRQ